MTQRMKRRYLLLHVVGDQSISEGALMDTLWKALFQLFGEYGASQARLTLIEYNSQERRAIVRCLNRALQMVRASITSITEINDKPAAIHVLRVSGTLKGLRRKAQLHDQCKTNLPCARPKANLKRRRKAQATQ